MTDVVVVCYGCQFYCSSAYDTLEKLHLPVSYDILLDRDTKAAIYKLYIVISLLAV